MDDYQLLIDLHRDAHRQGPGGDAETRIALDLSMLDQTAPLRVADIGCGTGAATIPLARELNAQITAVDLLPEFLETLQERARDAGVFEQISTLSCSMDNLPFQEEGFDVIWSEGAIYNIGFEHGIKAWRQYLKEAGVLVVSEISWITASRPAGLQQYWEAEYPEIDVASAKIALLEKFPSAEERQAMLRTLIDWIREYETGDDEYGLRRHRAICERFDGKKSGSTLASSYRDG